MLHVEDQAQKKDSKLLFRLLELGVAGLLEGGAEKREAGKDEKGQVAEVPSVAWWGERPPKRGEVHR